MTDTWPSRNIRFIADDFGASDAGNQAMLDAHLHGALNGVSLMIGQRATAAAVALAHDHPGLEVGLHLHLVDSLPCTRDRWPWGNSPVRAGFAMGMSIRHRRWLRDEIQCQWDGFVETGLDCRFINAHHHLHQHPFVRKTLLEVLPADFSGWLRWGRPRFFGRNAGRFFASALYTMLQQSYRDRIALRLSNTLWGLDRLYTMNAREIADVIPRLGDGLHEFMFHPRRIDDADSRCLRELRRVMADLQDETARRRVPDSGGDR
ncbi:MAG: ChbG/HpnK family deacetylase [Wenzhouxiangella sp.]